MRTIVVVGVPWSLHEMALALRDAAALGACVRVVDEADALARLDASLDCDRRPVPAMGVAEVAAAAVAPTPDAVVSITELTMELAASVRERLGLPGTSSAVERAITDKVETRRALCQAGLTAVDVWETTITELPGLVRSLALPVVVKPRAFTGSHGVRLLSTPGDVADAVALYDRDVAARFGRDRLLVESFVSGTEVSAEALVVAGELTLVALTDKFNTGPPSFSETGHVLPSRLTGHCSARVQEYLQAAVSALGLVTSSIHAELKLTDDHVELIEVHSRWGGGNIVRLLEEALGFRPYEAYFAAVMDGRLPGPATARRVCGIGFFEVPPDRPFAWRSFAVPHPSAVVEIDLDTQRRPRLREYQGIRFQYWRCGHALFASSSHGEVSENVAFMCEEARLACAK